MKNRVKVKVQFADGYNYLYPVTNFHEAVKFALNELWCPNSHLLPIQDVRQKILDTKDEDLYNEFIEEVNDVMNAFEHLTFKRIKYEQGKTS